MTHRIRIRPLACMLAAALIVVAHPAAAQIFGQYGGAETLPVNGRSFGAYVETSDHLLGATSQLRLSFFPGIDFGFQLGLTRLSPSTGDRTTVRLGTDVRTAIVEATPERPYTVAVGGAIGVETSDQYSVLTIAPEGVVSRSYRLSDSAVLRPYLGALISIAKSSVLGESNTDLSVPIRLGTELEVRPAVRFLFEVQLLPGNAFTDHFKVAAGANFPF